MKKKLNPILANISQTDLEEMQEEITKCRFCNKEIEGGNEIEMRSCWDCAKERLPKEW